MLKSKCLGITVFQSRLKVRTFARTNSYEYGKQRQVQESPWAVQADSHQESQADLSAYRRLNGVSVSGMC